MMVTVSRELKEQRASKGMICIPTVLRGRALIFSIWVSFSKKSVVL